MSFSKSLQFVSGIDACNQVNARADRRRSLRSGDGTLFFRNYIDQELELLKIWIKISRVTVSCGCTGGYKLFEATHCLRSLPLEQSQTFLRNLLPPYSPESGVTAHAADFW
jgi:hypothetical protein